MDITEAIAIRATFNTEMLNEGEVIKDETCPKCSHWVCGFPTYQFRNWQGKKSKVSIWECWNCRTEFIDVELRDKK